MVAKKRERGAIQKNFYYTKDGTIQFRKMIRGKLITGRTGMTKAHEVNKYAEDIRHQIISEHYKLKKDRKKQPKLNVLYKDWLKSKEHLSKNGFRTYKDNVNYYLKKGLPSNSSESRVYSLRRDYNVFARWCNKSGYAMQVLEGRTESEARTRVLNKKEIKKLFNVLYPKNFKDCIMFIYYTGARRKEAMAPKNEWLRKNNKGEYYLEVIKKGKNKRIIRISDQALTILKNRNMKFWSYSDQHLTKRFKFFARKANLEDTQLHDLRRTFGYELLVNGKDIAIVARLLGISIKVAYKHYTPLMVSDIDDFKI